MKDQPLSDQDIQFIREYGLKCWLRATKLPALDHETNGDRQSYGKYEADTGKQ